MSLAQSTPGGETSPTVLHRLRSETRDVHERLEQGLGLLDAPLDRDRFMRVLERFFGFHAVWEPAVGRALGDDAFLAPRLKLERLRRDLRALGRSDAEIDRLPRCFEAAQLAPLARRQAAALGSLYVLEGSTLGGQVITRALAGAPWLPADGLTYFDPYEAQTGAMWRAFRDYLLARSTPPADDEMVAVARATFERLVRWLI
jgi:heme oxygenase